MTQITEKLTDAVMIIPLTNKWAQGRLETVLKCYELTPVKVEGGIDQGLDTLLQDTLVGLQTIVLEAEQTGDIERIKQWALKALMTPSLDPRTTTTQSADDYYRRHRVVITHDTDDQPLN